MMHTTSATKTSHSVNHAQKKTRIRLPMAYGLTSDVLSQMPTPVSAPNVVVTTKQTVRMR